MQQMIESPKSNRNQFPKEMGEETLSFIRREMRIYPQFERKKIYSKKESLSPDDVSDWIESFSAYLIREKKVRNCTWLNCCPGSVQNPMYKFVVSGNDDRVSKISLIIRNEFGDIDELKSKELYPQVGKPVCIFQGHLFSQDITTSASAELVFICQGVVESMYIYQLSPNRPPNGTIEVLIGGEIPVILNCFMSGWKTLTIKFPRSRK